MITPDISEETKKLLLRSLFVKANFVSQQKQVPTLNVSRIAELQEETKGVLSYLTDRGQQKRKSQIVKVKLAEFENDQFGLEMANIEMYQIQGIPL